VSRSHLERASLAAADILQQRCTTAGTTTRCGCCCRLLTLRQQFHSEALTLLTERPTASQPILAHQHPPSGPVSLPCQLLQHPLHQTPRQRLLLLLAVLALLGFEPATLRQGGGQVCEGNAVDVEAAVDPQAQGEVVHQ
jgi:hypothetical protein